MTINGIVYVLINEAMPGYLKIGFTEGPLIDRIKGLDNTSLPLPFECFYAATVEDCKKVEKLVHDIFLEQRVRNNREFFEVDPERVKSALKLVELEDKTPIEDDLIQDNEDKNAISKTRKRKENVTFEMIDLGYDWQTVNGWSQWCYEGEPLDKMIRQIREE